MTRPLLILAGLTLAGFLVLTLVVLPHARHAPVLDLRINVWVSAHRSAGLTTVARVSTWFGSTPVLITVTVLVAFWLWQIRRRPSLASVFAAAVASTAGIVALIKIAVARLRPTTADLLGLPALDYSFPSGHTTNSAVVYLLAAIAMGLIFERHKRLLFWPMALLAVLVGCSRVYLGYHYLSDVLGGWLLATTVVAAAVTSMNALDHRRRTGPHSEPNVRLTDRRRGHPGSPAHKSPAERSSGR